MLPHWRIDRRLQRSALFAAAAFVASQTAQAASPPRPDHVVVVIEENHSLSDIFGASASTPYLAALAAVGASFTDSHGIERPSQPNYLDLFSGNNQGTGGSNDYLPNTPLTTPNLGAQLRALGLSFTGYSQGLPAQGSLVESASSSGLNEYVHKHNPWANWQANAPAGNQLPPTINQPFTAFPQNFDSLATVSFVVPDEQNDMHDGSIQQGDAWLAANLDRYYQWAQFHNSLLIVTFDEDSFTDENHIPTILAGPMIRPGQYTQRIDHFSMLRTIEDMYGLPHIAAAQTASTITDAFYPIPRTWLPGDANFDGSVNALDFTILGLHFNALNATWTSGDFNGDGICNALDFNALAASFGRSSPIPAYSASTAGPEPGSLVITSVPMMWRARRRAGV